MSFPYPPGSTAVPHSALEHATDMLNSLNATLAAQNVRVGNPPVLVQLAPKYTNVVWLILLAVGAIRAVYDNILVAAGQMFSVSECSDDQLNACLPLSGTSYIPGAYSFATVRVTAGGGGAATIPDGASIPLGEICNFVVPAGHGVSIPASTFADILVVADVLGPIEAAAHTLTAFAVVYANVASVDNSAQAVPGRYAETPQQIRQRLLAGSIGDTNQDGTVRAVKSIPGIEDAILYFNFSKTVTLDLPGGISIPTRTAYLVVQGTDPTGTAIASAYAKRMSAPTFGGSSQTYVTLSGQLFQVKYDAAGTTRIYVTVYYDDTQASSAGFENEIQLIVSQIALKIGQEVTSAQILQALEGFSDAVITGAQVSLNGLTWANLEYVNGNSVASFAIADVTVAPNP